MPIVALLDANVLVNAAVRDTLLRAAEAGLYQPVLSAEILEEMGRALRGNLGLTSEQTDHLLDQMTNAFGSAMVEDYHALVPVMKSHAGDRHVLAAAVQAGAGYIVTFNLRHFPVSVCRQHGLEARSPDRFLLALWDADAPRVWTILQQQAAAIKWDLDRLLERLHQDAPQFIQAARRSL